ncbi:hypothetical protein GQX74_001424 [Glossina fuscipes]|nr:hypothetical protein GQX74_001424 [Glossina fuscipes]
MDTKKAKNQTLFGDRHLNCSIYDFLAKGGYRYSSVKFLTLFPIGIASLSTTYFLFCTFHGLALLERHELEGVHIINYLRKDKVLYLAFLTLSTYKVSAASVRIPASTNHLPHQSHILSTALSAEHNECICIVHHACKCQNGFYPDDVVVVSYGYIVKCL